MGPPIKERTSTPLASRRSVTEAKRSGSTLMGKTNGEMLVFAGHMVTLVTPRRASSQICQWLQRFASCAFHERSCQRAKQAFNSESSTLRPSWEYQKLCEIPACEGQRSAS